MISLIQIVCVIQFLEYSRFKGDEGWSKRYEENRSSLNVVPSEQNI